LELQPEHLSLYLLEVKEGTQLYSQLKRQQRPQPDDDATGDMYRLICERARDAGYEQYEISNFAAVNADGSPSRFRSIHNLKYWTGASYFGFGCGAHSYDGQSRWSNILRTETYIAAVEDSGRAVAEQTTLALEERAAEALFMGLRLTDGVVLDDFFEQYGVDILKRYEAELPRLFEAGLIQVGDGRMALTERGRLLSNEVFVLFI
jgi:oxygen-independent coproporphyrinogen-3 oxidase